MITNNNVETLYYGYSDYLGSLVALTDANGNVVEKYAYDPWGARRNPTDWTKTDNRTTWIVNRGYTGHEHLDAFGIINMNGRVYDPFTAQFLSPDPFVQAPDTWLNFNRYSYVYGNPFRYTDPSGEFIWFIPVIIGAAIGAYSGWQIGKAHDATGWNMFGYIAGGAIIGGIAGYAGMSISTSLSASVIAGGGTSMEAAFVSGTATGMVTGAISNGGMTALAGGSIGDIIGATIKGGVVGGFSGAAGSVVFQGVNQFFENSLGGILKSILPTNTISYMAGSTASQMTSNIIQGRNIFKNVDYGFNLGMLLPLSVDVARGINSFQLNMAQKHNTDANTRILNTSDILSETTLEANGDLSLRISVSGEKLYNYQDPNGFSVLNEIFNNNTWGPAEFDININPFVSDYRSYVQMLYSLK